MLVRECHDLTSIHSCESKIYKTSREWGKRGKLVKRKTANSRQRLHKEKCVFTRNEKSVNNALVDTEIFMNFVECANQPFCSHQFCSISVHQSLSVEHFLGQHEGKKKEGERKEIRSEISRKYFSVP
uniref:Uncharacterized protein n=1 Tax=Cacopsylla melanoneura TaxID=428564 RepID=A0A8D8RFC8_9HEMI